MRPRFLVHWQAGSAIYASASATVDLVNCTFREHTGDSMLALQGNLRWGCLLGQWGPAGTVKALDFTGCPNLCRKGTIGTSTALTDPTQCKPCPVAHYCPDDGLAAGFPCPPGTSMPAEGTVTERSCIPCFPGQYNGELGQANCTACKTGEYSESLGATACTASCSAR